MPPPSNLAFSLRTALIEPLRPSQAPSQPRLLTPRIRSLHTVRKRKLHSTRRPEAAASTLFEPESQHGILEPPPQVPNPDRHAESAHPASPLSKVTTFSLIRSILIQQASSLPFLLRPSVAILSHFATTTSVLTSPDRNPVLKHILKPLIYNQFCAGENSRQVTATTRSLKSWGVQGILLGWAREVEFRKERGVDIAQQLEKQLTAPGAAAAAEHCIREWGQGTLKTVKLAGSGDFVSLKFSGAGPAVLYSLLFPDKPQCQHPLFDMYLHEVCKLAKSRGISLCIDAEQQRIQPGIDAITLALSRQYNKAEMLGGKPAHATIKNTYQMYLKSMPTRLSADLSLAASEGWVLGAKLVRGAYLASETPEVFWESKERTDAAYDGCAEGLMRRSWTAGGYLHGRGAFPEVDVVLATHNLVSVQKAVAIRQAQAECGEQRIPLVYAQLMGMADHVSAAAIQAGNEAKAKAKARNGKVEIEVPRVYKYLVWGSVQECMRYLVRRAEENRDAAGRTKESRAVLWAELKRRVLRR